MKYGVYAIKDTKIGFKEPMLMQNDEVAMRTFKGAVNSTQKNPANQYIEDTEFYKLGEFDDRTGEITPRVEYITNAISLKSHVKEKKEDEIL